MKLPLILLSWLLLHPLAAAAPISLEALEAKLRDIRFVSFTVENETLEKSLALLRKKSLETDEEPPSGTRTPDLILIPLDGATGATAHPAVKVAYSGNDVTLETVLREIAKTANQDVFLTSVGVVMVPKGLPPFPNPQAEKGEIFRKLTEETTD